MKNYKTYHKLKHSSTNLLVMVLLLFSTAQAHSSDKKPRVTVSILPQVWFVEQIAGNQVSVEALVGPGHSPATFEPTAKQMARLQDSIAFFSAGVPFEFGILPRIESMRKGPDVFGPRPQSGSHDHSHGHHHELDPHTWLDPQQAVAIADTIYRVLAQLVPEQADIFEQRKTSLKNELQKLHSEIAEILKPLHGQTFYVFHPAYGHLAKAYGMTQVAVEADGHEPGPRQLAKIIDQLKLEKARVIIVQPQFSKKAAQAIARETDAQVLVLDPLARNYDKNLIAMARTLGESLLENTQ
ncbi:MAG: zinc ABC transporter solute-binding protein [bacterium]|nr:zinc ABC transporter solute-binding protein [bacterium]